jgi:hypothetical protein
MQDKSFATLAGLFLLAACHGSSAILTTTGPRMPSRGDNCEFEMLTAPPAAGYIEVGTVDVEAGNYGNPFKSNLADFKSQIESRVCQAGGDAAVASANGYGVYVHATILKASDAPVSTPPPPAEAAPAPAPPVEPIPTAGCQYDAQCKGDRVCVRGECVEPAKK